MHGLRNRGTSLIFLLLLGTGAGAAEICSNYRSESNCAGSRRPLHEGIDFRGDTGTVVVSATHGTVVRFEFSECAGNSITVRTDIVARHEDVEGPVYARYVHTEPLEELKVGQKLRPGDPIGRIIPLRKTRCYSSATHTHYELRVRDSARRHINPHPYWVGGEGRHGCYRPGMEVPAGKAVAPLRCPP
jgi:murein DD-endopeptidase MepM/ murein hydrolase activator NlpD